jgi:hypothetical protein
MLIAIADLTGQSHGTKHVATVYERAMKAATEYLRSENQFASFDGLND